MSAAITSYLILLHGKFRFPSVFLSAALPAAAAVHRPRPAVVDRGPHTASCSPCPPPSPHSPYVQTPHPSGGTDFFLKLCLFVATFFAPHLPTPLLQEDLHFLTYRFDGALPSACLSPGFPQPSSLGGPHFHVFFPITSVRVWQSVGGGGTPSPISASLGLGPRGGRGRSIPPSPFIFFSYGKEGRGREGGLGPPAALLLPIQACFPPQPLFPCVFVSEKEGGHDKATRPRYLFPERRVA